MTGPEDIRGKVKLSFHAASVVLSLDRIISQKVVTLELKRSKKYLQILQSVKAVGLVETPIVAPHDEHPDLYYLLDGHLRVEVLKDLGIHEVECLISTDDEAYTFNKRINRLAAVQEHRMIVRAVERGVSEKRIANALGLDILSVKRRSRLLDGISPKAAALLRDKLCPIKTFDFLRQMTVERQVQAAELMVAQANFSSGFAEALLGATPSWQLVPAKKRKTRIAGTARRSKHMVRMERELTSLQGQVKVVEATYGLDNLHLTVAKTYVARLLSNSHIAAWINQNRPEYFVEFQSIAQMDDLNKMIESRIFGENSSSAESPLPAQLKQVVKEGYT